MEIKYFFTFGDDYSSSTFQASAIDLKKDRYGINEHDHLIKGKYDRINFPVIFKQECGKNLKDILGVGWGGLYIISDKLKTLLEENKLTGWKTFPIKLYDKKNNEIFGYQGFSVTGHCGPIDYKKAEIIDKQMIPTGPVFKAYKGLCIGLDKWDDSDFFIPDNSLFFIITAKAANIFKNDKTLNIRLTNCADFETFTFSVLEEKK